MDKRGQFFLIAAFVIIGILIGLSTVYIAIHTIPEEKKVYDLSKEINEESAQIITNGIVANSENIEKNIDSLAQEYSKTYPDSEIAVIYGKPGESQGPTLRNYYACTGASVTLETSTTFACVKVSSLPSQLSSGTGANTFTVTPAKLTVNLKGESHEFNLPQDSQQSYFYIIVRTPKLGQRTVAAAGSA